MEKNTVIIMHMPTVMRQATGAHQDSKGLCNLAQATAFLKANSKIADVYWLSCGASCPESTGNQSVSVIFYEEGTLEGHEPEAYVLYCLSKIAHEPSQYDKVLLICGFPGLLLRYSLEDFLSALDTHDMAFSAVRENKKLWHIKQAEPDKAQRDSSIFQAEPLDLSGSGSCRVAETGEIYAFGIAALLREKERFSLRAKAVLASAKGAVGTAGYMAERGPAEEKDSRLQAMGKQLDSIQKGISELDGLLKCFVLSQNGGFAGMPPHNIAQAGGCGRFPNKIQKILIFFYAYFVWLGGDKSDFDRLRKNPAKFFRVTKHSANFFFLKILCMLGPKPEK